MTNTHKIFVDSTNCSFSTTDLPLTGDNSLKQLPVLSNKSQLNKVIVRPNNTPDHLAINLYWDTFRSWYTPHKIYSVDGSVFHIPKLRTKGIFLDYNKLSENHGVSKEIIRQKIVKLEKLGLVNRSFQHKETVTTKSFNRLIIYVWQQTAHFFNSCGIDRKEVSELIPQTNHKYVAEKHNIKFNCNTLLNKATESRGVSKKIMDTKELREAFSIEKDRSTKSNFCKNSFFKKGEGSLRVSKDAVPVVAQTKTTPRPLEAFYPLSTEDAKSIRISCGREFTLNAMNEILLDMSKRVKDRWFKSKKGFLSYMTKVFAYEKRDAIKIGNEGFRIRGNKTMQEVTIAKQEEFLSQIEYSRHVSPEWHLKKKLCSVLERDKAYNLLSSFKHCHLEDDTFEIHLTKAVELTDWDRNIILQQAKASHEKCNLAEGMFIVVNNLKIIVQENKQANGHCSSASSNLPKLEQSAKVEQGNLALPDNIWGTIRRALIQHYGESGEAIDRSWFSKLEANIDETAKIITLKAPTAFLRDWIKNNYSQVLDMFTRQYQHSYEIC